MSDITTLLANSNIDLGNGSAVKKLLAENKIVSVIGPDNTQPIRDAAIAAHNMRVMRKVVEMMQGRRG